MGVEKVIDKKGKETIGRAYVRVIDTASAKDFRPFFEEKISKDAKVETDGWRGYLPLNKDWNITKKPSDKGKGFPELHTHIMNIKSWIRGIHHKCSATRLQNYLDEFHFRFNRRSFLQSIFDKLLKRMVLNGPISYKTRECEPST